MPWLEKRPRRDKKNHICKRPRIGWWIPTGARWQCGECGWVWEIVAVKRGYSYRDWDLMDSR